MLRRMRRVVPAADPNSVYGFDSGAPQPVHVLAELHTESIRVFVPPLTNTGEAEQIPDTWFLGAKKIPLSSANGGGIVQRVEDVEVRKQEHVESLPL